MKKKLMQAAKLIQSYCINNENCEKCPFNDGEDCKLQMDSPHRWNINDDIKENNNEKE